MNFDQRVYQLCKKIPRGRVSTYKVLAYALNTKAYRAVGQALRKNPYAPRVPCHRVVASDGRLHGFQGKKQGAGLKEKQRMLEQEGLQVQRGKIKNFEERLFMFEQ